MDKKSFLSHHENNMIEWELEELRLRKKTIKAIVMIVLAGLLFALILCDIFGAFGEGSIIVKIITAITMFMALVKGFFDIFNIYLNLHNKK